MGSARVKKIPVTLANAATTTSAADLEQQLDVDEAIVGIELPTGLTGTAITLTNSIDGGTTYRAVLKTDGTAYTVTCAAARYVVIPPADLKGLTNCKLVSGTSQSGAVTIYLVAARVA